MGENPENLPQVNGYDDYYGFLSVSDMYTEWRDQYYNPEVVRDERRTTYMDNNKFSHYLIHATPAKGCQALAEITIPWEAKALNEENAERIKSGQETIPNRGNPNNCTPVYKEIDNDPLLNQLLTEKFGHDIQHSFLRVSLADLDKLWAEYSVKFIHDQVGKSQPWFLYHATRGCHFDNYPQNDDRRVSYARTIYSECTVEIDDILGKLMGALRETGLDKDTLVFLSSDNGPEDEIPPHGHTPFRGGKGSTWEGGVRVPGIAYWPGMVQAGRTSDGLFDLADLYTTTLTLAGFDYAATSTASIRLPSC
jgi:arylsulfatase